MAFSALRAKSSPPSPPCSQTFAAAHSTPIFSHSCVSASTSSSESATKWLSATTAGSPKTSRAFSMWRRRLANPSRSALTSGLAASAAATRPLLYFSALQVATITAHLGAIPAARHLMSMNFSMPKSAPKPASVTTTSAMDIAIWVAASELQPCAMFANGPPWTNAGVPSRVWTRLGFRASFKSAVIAPAALSSPQVTGLSS